MVKSSKCLSQYPLDTVVRARFLQKSYIMCNSRKYMKKLNMFSNIQTREENNNGYDETTDGNEIKGMKN